MKPVYIFGDCHSARVYEHWNPKECPVDLTVWGKGGTNCWSLKLKTKYEENLLSSGVETNNLHGVSREELIFGFNKIKDNGLIMPWLGYCDIRQYLPKYNNAEFLVEKYFKEITDYYQNSKIKFIEPLPQFTEMYLKYEGIHPSYTYEERIKQNDIFINHLRKLCFDYGLEKPISQEQIYDAVGVTKFTPDVVATDKPHPVDSLKQEYFGKIYNLFIQEALFSL